MKVLALPRLDGNFQHSHGLAFKEEAVVCRGGDQRIQVKGPFRIVGLRHVVLRKDGHT
jgi:hypothetical protein